MELTSAPATDRSVVVFLGEALPAQGLAELRVRLSEVLAAGDARLVVDVCGVQRMSSAVVAALLWTNRQCRARGIEVAVRGASSHGDGLLGRTGLGAVLSVEEPDR